MYNECSTVLDVVGPLLERANRGVAPLGVPQVSVLSIESQTSFLGDVLRLLKAGPTRAKDTGYIRSALQSGYMLKKYRFGGNPEARELAAIRAFIDRDSSLAAPSSDPWLKAAIQQRMREILKKALPLVAVWSPKFGDGAVAEHVPWLARWERIATYPELHQGNLIPVSLGLSLKGGDSVRLCAVPKDYAKDRLITVEPWLNTFAQHATRRILYESVHTGPLRGTAMDALYVEPEAIQQAYAVEGSKNGLYATLDLSDASDSMSLADVEATFPPWITAWLLSCRTPQYDAGDGRIRMTTMYAGMGNATTFAVQTLYFWAACAAIAWLSGLRRYHVSVHGDDIVVDSRLAQLILEVKGFEALGLKMNSAKSYWGDCSFRESCGIWALNGLDVTPSRFDGFDLSVPAGRIGFADVIRRMVRSGCGMQLMLADRLVKRSSHIMKVVPINVPGSELVPDERELWSDRYDKYVTRLNVAQQVFECRVEMPELKKLRVPADRVGYLYGAMLGCVTTDVQRTCPTEYDVDQLMAKWRNNEARTRIRAGANPLFVLATYLRDCDIVADWFRRGRIREHVVTLPLKRGKLRLRKRWLPIEGLPVGASSRIASR